MGTFLFLEGGYFGSGLQVVTRFCSPMSEANRTDSERLRHISTRDSVPDR